MGWNVKKLFMGVLMAGLITAGCSSNSSEPSSGNDDEKQKEMTVRIAYNLQKEHAVGVYFETLAKEIEKNTENTSIKLKTQTFSDGQLYNDTQMADAISNGGVEIGGMNAGMVASEAAPLLAAFDLPFNFASFEAEKAALNSEYGELIAKDFETLNVKLIGWAKFGTGDVFGNEPIKVPNDLKSKKIRSVGKAMSQWLEHIGASPVSMSSQEVFQAMERNMMDGYTSGVSALIERSLYEVTKYGTQMSLVHTSFPAGANIKWWNNLPEDVQDAIIKASKTAEEASRKKAQEDDKMYTDKAKEYGVELYKPTEEELKLWKESAAPLYDEFAKQSDKAQLVIDAMNKANEEHPAN